MRWFLIFLFTFYSSVHSDEISKDLQQKLDIVIPVFKVDEVNLKGAIVHLQNESMIYDPSKKGLNIVFLKNDLPKNIKNNIERDPFADDDPFENSNFGSQILNQSFGFDFKKVSVHECLKIICNSIGASFRIDRNAVIVAAPRARLINKNWYYDKIQDNILNHKNEIIKLKKELALLQKIKDLPKEKADEHETFKENVIIPKLRFEGQPLSRVVEYIERQTPYLTKNNKKIPVAIYIPADVKLPKFSLEANNLPILDLAKYIAEQLGVETSVEKGEITFREAKPLSITNKTYKFTKNEGNYLIRYGLEGLKKKLILFGMTFPVKSNLSINHRESEITLINTKENHKRLQQILQLIK